MHATVRLRLPNLTTATLSPGDVIGRVDSSALALDDPRVSEAHALVSMRRGELYLLALRRLLGVRGKPVSEVRLLNGLAIEFADDLVLTVDEVITPSRVAALKGPGIGPRALGHVTSILAGLPGQPGPLVGRFVPGAEATLWSVNDSQWRLRVGDEPTRTLDVGETFSVHGHTYALCWMAPGASGVDPTIRGGDLEPPLRIMAHYDGVEIHRPEQPVITIGGIGAQLFSELATINGPVNWEIIARILWRDAAEPSELRRRWDVALNRLRARLREGGVRPSLLRSDGAGQVQLVLNEADEIVDLT